MRAIKLVLWGLLALALLAIIAAGVVVSTFDANSYRELLGESVERATGRRLTIDGELSLRVWPQIALRAEQLRLANPPNFPSEQPMLQVEAVEATIALQPLLQREVKIDGVVLYSPVLALQQTSSNTNNWSDLQQRFGASSTAAAGQLAVQLTSVTLHQATLSLQQGDSVVRLITLDAQASFTTKNELALVANGAWQIDTPTESIDLTAFTLTTKIDASEAHTLLSDVEFTTALPDATESLVLSIPTAAIDADLNKAYIKQGTAHVADSTLNFAAEFSNLLDAAQLEGSISTKAANTAALLKLANVEMPDNLPATRLGALDLTATLSAPLTGSNLGAAKVHEFKATLAGLKLQAEGELSTDTAGTATGSLTVAAPVDLRALAAALPEFFEADLFRSATTSTLKPTLQRLQTDFKWVPAETRTAAQLSFSNTRFSALGITGTAEGSSLLTEPATTTTATITLAEFSPKQALTYFLEPILTEEKSALGSASGTLTLQQDLTGSHLKELDIALDNSRLRGELSLLTAPLPRLRFNINLDTLDVTDYLAPAASAADTAADNDLLGSLVLPTELLRAYDLNGSFRIKRLQLYDLLLSEVGARLTLGNGAATLNNLSARLYGGSFIGEVGFTETADSGSNSAPELSVTGDLQRVVVQSLMQAVSNTQDFTGRGNVQINLTGRGTSALEAVQSAAGKFSLQLQEGSYTGINIGHELCRLYNGLRNKPAPSALTTKGTSFDTFSASATVVNGLAKTNDLLASNSYLKLSGTGSTQLAQQSVYYDLDIELTGPIETPNCETLTPHIGSRIPVRLTGTFANPKLRPDFGKLASREIVRRVEDKLTEKLFDLLGGKKTQPEPEGESEPSTGTGSQPEP